MMKDFLLNWLKLPKNTDWKSSKKGTVFREKSITISPPPPPPGLYNNIKAVPGAWTWCPIMVNIVGHLIISTHPFWQVPILKFGQGASAHVEGVDIVQGHLAHGVSGHQVLVC